MASFASLFQRQRIGRRQGHIDSRASYGKDDPELDTCDKPGATPTNVSIAKQFWREPSGALLAWGTSVKVHWDQMSSVVRPFGKGIRQRVSNGGWRAISKPEATAPAIRH